MESYRKESLGVMIVDDSAAIVRKIEAMLSESQFEDFVFESADSLESAEDILRHFKCDIVLLDLNLADSKGLDTLIKIKQKHPDLPVIVITGAYKDELGVKAVSIGAQDFLIKNKLDAYSLNKAINYAIERKRFERKLLEFEARWRSLVQSVPDIIINIAHNGKILFINRTIPWFAGFTIKDVIGQEIYKFISSENQEKIKKSIDIVFNEGKVAGFESKIVLSDNSIALYAMRFSPIIQDNKIIAANMTATDISERIRISKQLQQSKMLESIGTLASGIAHEINTPMQYIGDNTLFFSEGVINLFELINTYQNLLDECCCDDRKNIALEKAGRAIKEADLEYLRQEIPSAINQSLEGIDRVKRIINAMKFFSHVDTDVMAKGNINQAIESSAMVSKNEWKYVADLETHLDSAIPEIPCFIGEINQVIMNLIINAAHAIADVVGNRIDGKGLIKITSKKEDSFIIITVDDTGSGIPDEIKDRIFDPFFTTKDVGKGTGQGLSLAYDVIVGKHKGSISCESQVGKGTSFIIKLPIEID